MAQPRPTAEWLWIVPPGTSPEAMFAEANAAIRAYFKMGSSFPDSQLTEISLFHGSVLRIRAFGKKSVANRLHHTIDKRWSELKSQHDYTAPPAPPTEPAEDGMDFPPKNGGPGADSVIVHFAPSNEPETVSVRVTPVIDGQLAPEPAGAPEPPQEPAEPLPPLPDPMPSNYLTLNKLAQDRGVDIADIKGPGTVKRIQERLWGTAKDEPAE